MFSCFFVHLVDSPANTFASECIFSHDEIKNIPCAVCYSSKFINTLDDKLLFILLENTDNNATKLKLKFL